MEKYVCNECKIKMINKEIPYVKGPAIEYNGQSILYKCDICGYTGDGSHFNYDE